jgi:hypothetical protein
MSIFYHKLRVCSKFNIFFFIFFAFSTDCQTNRTSDIRDHEKPSAATTATTTASSTATSSTLAPSHSTNSNHYNHSSGNKEKIYVPPPHSTPPATSASNTAASNVYSSFSNVYPSLAASTSLPTSFGKSAALALPSKKEKAKLKKEKKTNKFNGYALLSAFEYFYWRFVCLCGCLLIVVF